MGCGASTAEVPCTQDDALPVKAPPAEPTKPVATAAPPAEPVKQVATAERAKPVAAEVPPDVPLQAAPIEPEKAAPGHAPAPAPVPASTTTVPSASTPTTEAPTTVISRTKALFDEVDVSGTGSVSKAELFAKLRADKQLESLLDMKDVSGKGMLGVITVARGGACIFAVASRPILRERK